jgi:acyl-CoA thioesterase
MPEKLTRKLEEHDPFGKYTGLTLTKWEKGYSQFILKVNKKLLNPYSALHGGVTFTMADSGMGWALVSCLDKGERCVTIEAKIVFFKAVNTGTLTCDTRVIHKSKRIATLESEIKHGGELIAKAIGTWSIYEANGE